jgi:hypothetical protein
MFPDSDSSRDLHNTEVTGKFSSVVDKMKIGGPMILYNGSIAAASATFVGHYP